jgi:trk system potassium uptake protein TrkA
MRVVIVGCGRLGSTLAKGLTADGHTVAIIDRSRDAFRRLEPKFAGKTVVGLGIDEDVMIRAGIEKADVFVAVTNFDTTNIMASQIARQRFGVPRVLTRVVEPVRAHVYHELGLDTYCTTTVSASLIRAFVDGKSWEDMPEGIKFHGDPGPLEE